MTRSILVKTLKGESFRIDMAEEALMSDVKRKISEDRGVDPSGQILISSGKTLKDEDSLSDSVSASGFLVLMMKVSKAATPFILYMQFKRARRAAPPPASASTPTPTTKPPAPAPTPAPTTAVASAGPSTGAAGASSVAAVPTPARATSAGGDLPIVAANVEQLTAMGFPEDQARVALRAAFNDVSRAASYLMEGIPEGAMDEADDVNAEPRGGADGIGTAMGEDDDDEDDENDRDALMAAAAEAFAGGEGGGGNPLNFLRFHPQFEQLRTLVRENPSMLQQVLQQLGTQSPELVERISAHPDDFLRLMNDPPDEEGQAMMEMGIEGLMEGIEGMDDEESPSGSGDGVGREGRQDEGGSFAQPRDQVTVELTQEENDAVENLMAMVPGVGRDQVIEAFIACDKNAEMAANLLFENAI
ncbi:unnamed protein product [Ascophyllum nodosum]